MTGVTHEALRKGRTEEKLDSIDTNWAKAGEQTVRRISPPAAADRAYWVITWNLVQSETRTSILSGCTVGMHTCTHNPMHTLLTAAIS